MSVQHCPACNSTLYLDTYPEGKFLICSGPKCKYNKLISTTKPPSPPEKEVNPTKAKTEVLGTAIRQIPIHSLQEIGRIFEEGAAKYGRDNWKKGVNDKEYQAERLEHAITHLMKYANGDTSENHLAKVAWFCVTQLEHTRLEIAENS